MSSDFFALGQKIRQQRKELRWTQAKLAEVSGVARPKISEIERGVVNEIGFRKLLRILTALGLTFQVVRIDPTPLYGEKW